MTAWRALLLCVGLSGCVCVHATNFAVLLNGGKDTDGDGLCGSDDEVLRTIGPPWVSYGLKRDIGTGARFSAVGDDDDLVPDGFDFDSEDFDPYSFFGEGYGDYILQGNGELDDGGMGQTLETIDDFPLMRERPCVKDWEVNGCNGNCTIKVPIHNNGPDAIKLADIKLYCAQGGGESIGVNGVPYFHTVPPLPGQPNIGYLGMGYDIRRVQWLHRLPYRLKREIGTGARVDSTVPPLPGIANVGYLGGQAAGTRVRKGMQDLKVVSFSGGIAPLNPQVVECPANTVLALVDPPDVIPPYSEVLLALDASIPETVRVLLVTETSPPTPSDNTRRSSDLPSTANASVVLDLVQTSVADILNMPFLCCVKSVRQRVSLGRVLVDALAAYEAGDVARMLEFLRWFIRYAQAVECDVSGAETLCIEQAIEAVMAAARMAGEEHGEPELEGYGDQGDDLRRRGQGEAAMLAYRRKGGHFKGSITQYPATYSLP